MALISTASNLAPRRQPFLFLAGTLALGILLDTFLQPRGGSPALVLFLLALFGSVLSVRAHKDRYATALILVAVVMAGTLLSFAGRTRVAPDRLRVLFESGKISPSRPVELAGVLARPPEPLPNGFYIDVSAEHLTGKDMDQSASGVVRLAINLPDERRQKEFQSLSLVSGARVRILVRLERAQIYSNPGSPDFNDFLERRGYDLKGAIKSPLLMDVVGFARVSPALAALWRVRLWIMRSIDARFGPRVAGTLKAMLTGNRAFLDQSVVKRLRAGSTFHVVVIAGLHVGIIAWLLMGGHMGRGHIGLARVLVTLVVLWTYAIMVGLAPPVTRATIMITVGLAGTLLFRQAVTINSLSLAIFLMLAFDPSMVRDPGFQLSVAAVGGIVALALPLTDRLREIGQWKPSSSTPHPPACHKWIRTFAECLFWDQTAHDLDTAKSPVKFGLSKARAAVALGRSRFQPVFRWLSLLVVTSTAIQLSTLPLMIIYFNRIAPIGIVLNVMAGLLTAIIMAGGIVVILVGALNAWIGAKLAWIVVAAHHILMSAVLPFRDVPGATFRVPHYQGLGAGLYLLYFVPLFILAVLVDRWRPVDHALLIAPASNPPAAGASTTAMTGRSFAASLHVRPPGSARAAKWALVMLVALLIAVARPIASTPKGKLSIDFLDVGQGDSALVIFPLGSSMLIDGGGPLPIGGRSRTEKSSSGTGETVDDELAQSTEPEFVENGFPTGEEVVSRYMWYRGLRQIDYVLATHAHEDHATGLLDVMENFRIGELIVGHAPASNTLFSNLARSSAAKSVDLAAVSTGEGFEIEGVKIRVLWPPPAAADQPVKSGNNESVVLRLEYGSVSFLLTGDIEHPAEETLAAAGQDLHADLIKVAHHGSKTSSTDLFLDQVRPSYAVVSVGEKSRFAHPSRDVINRYLARGTHVYQTGRDGMVTAETDGATLRVRSYRTNRTE